MRPNPYARGDHVRPRFVQATVGEPRIPWINPWGASTIWWNRLDLNQRHPGLQPGALPTELQFHVAESAELESDTIPGTIRLAGGPQTFWVHSPYLAGAAGFEPANAGVRDRCLTTWRHPNIGRGKANRTLNLRFWRPLLYQLSYTPVW